MDVMEGLDVDGFPGHPAVITGRTSAILDRVKVGGTVVAGRCDWSPCPQGKDWSLGSATIGWPLLLCSGSAAKRRDWKGARGRPKIYRLGIGERKFMRVKRSSGRSVF